MQLPKWQSIQEARQTKQHARMKFQLNLSRAVERVKVPLFLVLVYRMKFGVGRIFIPTRTKLRQQTFLTLPHQAQHSIGQVGVDVFANILFDSINRHVRNCLARMSNARPSIPHTVLHAVRFRQLVSDRLAVRAYDLHYSRPIGRSCEIKRIGRVGRHDWHPMMDLYKKSSASYRLLEADAL